jgi:hypothetical protein
LEKQSAGGAEIPRPKQIQECFWGAVCKNLVER